MKNLLATSTFILALGLAATSASANGFMPWTDAAIAREAIGIQDVTVEAAGFAPWRDREVIQDSHDDVNSTNFANTKFDLNVFRPWS